MEERLREVLRGMDTSEIVGIHNTFCDENNYADDVIIDMCEFSEIFCNDDAEEIARRCFYGSDEWREESSFNPNRNYFYFNGYGNPVSFDYADWNTYGNCYNCHLIDESAIIDWLIESRNDCGNDAIAEIFEESEEENND